MSDRVVLSDQVLIQKVEEESVLLNIPGGTYFGLDPVGTRCWEVLAETGSIDRTVETIVAEYDVEPERVRQDLENLIVELTKHGLVQADAG